MTAGPPETSLFRRLRTPPVDISAVLAVVVLTDIVLFVPVPGAEFLGVLLAVPFALFCPGYAFVAALFPEAGRPMAERAESDGSVSRWRFLPNRGIDGPERAVLSLGMSVAIVPLIGLVLNFTPWGIRVVPVAFGISALTVVASVIGALRRQSLPASERFVVPYRRWLGTVRSATGDSDARIDVLLGLIITLTVVLVVSTVAYTAVVPRGGEQFTELSLLSTNETGAPIASGYPREFDYREERTVLVGIENNERRPTNYTVVVQLQRVQNRTDGSVVVDERTVDRFGIHLDEGERTVRRHTVAPTMTGENLRLTYLLYRCAVPPDPSTTNAYREVHLWIDVAGAQANGSTRSERPHRTTGIAS